MPIDILTIVLVLAATLLSMTFHEAMHAFVGYWLGDDTAKHSGRLTLNPIAHIDPFYTLLLPVVLAIFGQPIFGAAKPVPFNPARLRGGDAGPALVAIAGPITNLILAFISVGIVTLTPVGGVLQAFFFQMIIVNLGFFVFNIIPIPPLDGSRVLYALAPDFIRRGMERIEQFGLFVIFGLVLLAGPVLGVVIQSVTGYLYRLFHLIFTGSML